MAGKHIDIKTQDGTCDCYFSFSDDRKSLPAVIYYMDAFGLRESLFKMVDRIAALGYAVLAPNVFYRSGRAPLIKANYPLKPEEIQEVFKQIQPLFSAFDWKMAMKDAPAFFDFLSQQKEVKTGPIGVTGYCLGGGLAIRLAESFGDKVGAAASFHAGRLATDADDSPHKFLNKIKAPIYFGHADNDHSMPSDQIVRFDQALKEAHLKYESEVYKGAMHGFTQTDLPAYNKGADEKHWKKLSTLFDENL